MALYTPKGEFLLKSFVNDAKETAALLKSSVYFRALRTNHGARDPVTIIDRVLDLYDTLARSMTHGEGISSSYSNWSQMDATFQANFAELSRLDCRWADYRRTQEKAVKRPISTARQEFTQALGICSGISESAIARQRDRQLDVYNELLRNNFDKINYELWSDDVKEANPVLLKQEVQFLIESYAASHVFTTTPEAQADQLVAFKRWTVTELTRNDRDDPTMQESAAVALELGISQSAAIESLYTCVASEVCARVVASKERPNVNPLDWFREGQLERFVQLSRRIWLASRRFVHIASDASPSARNEAVIRLLVSQFTQTLPLYQRFVSTSGGADDTDQTCLRGTIKAIIANQVYRQDWTQQENISIVLIVHHLFAAAGCD